MGIEWTDGLSMSNDETDEGHKRIIELINLLNDEIVSQKRDRDNIISILDLLMDAAIPHFDLEEQIVAESSASAAQELNQSHSQLRSDFKYALINIQNSGHVARWVENGLKIEAAFVEHMVNVDTKYIRYFRTKN